MKPAYSGLSRHAELTSVSVRPGSPSLTVKVVEVTLPCLRQAVS